MTVNDTRTAEEHWEYTYWIIKDMLELCEYLYKEAMIHGIKHGREENQTSEQKASEEE